VPEETKKASNGSEPEMSVLNEQTKSPSLLAKVFGLAANGKKPVVDQTFLVTADGAAVVDFEKLVKDEDFKDSASAVLDFAKKYGSTAHNGSRPKSD
jgi:hypothetical protein